MIPTNFLRQVPIKHDLGNGHVITGGFVVRQFDVTGYRLQQWHSKANGDGALYYPEPVPTYLAADVAGWRDVPIDGTGEGGK